MAGGGDGEEADEGIVAVGMQTHFASAVVDELGEHNVRLPTRVLFLAVRVEDD